MIPTTATRRAARSAGPGFASQRARSPAWRASSGRIRSLETMVPRARVATMIMPVAAERPPRKATRASDRPAELARDRDHEGVGLRAAVGEEREAGDRDRKHEEVDGDEVEREGPGGGADVVDVGVLHHRDVELARQAEEGERGQHAGRPPALVEGVEAEQPHEVGVGAHGGGEPAGRAEGEEGDGAADEERRGELDDRLGRDREHQAAVRLVGVDAAHPEEHGEGRHRGGDDQRGAAGQPADVAARAPRS